jgi:hypothetical protein
MAMRGMKTLHVRCVRSKQPYDWQLSEINLLTDDWLCSMKEHAKNAMAVAQFLEKHPAVDKVIYPGPSIHFALLARATCPLLPSSVICWLTMGRPGVAPAARAGQVANVGLRWHDYFLPQR